MRHCLGDSAVPSSSQGNYNAPHYLIWPEASRLLPSPIPDLSISAPERHFVALPLLDQEAICVSSPQLDYYRARAIEEREAASRATESNVAGLHEQMARMYESLASELDRPRHAVAPAW